MRIWIAAVGTRPREIFEELAGMYLERIAAYLPGGSKAGLEAPVFRSEDALREAVEREGARTAPLLVMLDERGKQLSSEAFAAWLGRERDEGRQLVIFAVGPADGWKRTRSPDGQGAGKSATGRMQRARGSEEHNRADLMLSLGPMTMAHELARVVIAEQIYRALTILKGHPYHRA